MQQSINFLSIVEKQWYGINKSSHLVELVHTYLYVDSEITRDGSDFSSNFLKPVAYAINRATLM